MEMSRAERIRVLKGELDNKKQVGSGCVLLQALTDSISEAELMEKVAEGMPEKIYCTKGNHAELDNTGFGCDECVHCQEVNKIIDLCKAYWTSRVNVDKIYDILCEPCPHCEGKGWTAEHDSNCDGSCEQGNCPVQEQCDCNLYKAQALITKLTRKE